MVILSHHDLVPIPTRAIVQTLCATPLREGVAIIAAFTGAAIVAMYPVLNAFGSALPNDLGDPLLNTWILAWDADRFLHGLEGLWDAPMYFPYARSFAYSEHLLGIAIFTAPIQWLTGNPVMAYNSAFLASFVLAGSGMYLLAASLTGSRLAGVVSGMAFAFLPYRAEQVSHLQVLMYGWMPIALWGLHRYFQTGRRSMLGIFAIAFLLQALSNGYFVYYLAATVVVVGGVGLVARIRTRPIMLLDLVCAAALMVALLLPIANAYLEARELLPLYRMRSEIVSYSADIESYAQASPRLALWGDLLPAGKPEGSLFPGFALSTMALFGFVAAMVSHRSRTTEISLRRTAALYTLIALVGLMLSLGPEPTANGVILTNSGPYDWLLSTIPGLDALRVPARASVIVFLALAVLAAIATRRLLDRLPARMGVVCCLVAVAMFVVEGYHEVHMSEFSVEPSTDEAAANAWLSRRPRAGTLVLPFQPRDPIPQTLRAVLQTLEHRQPLVNGYSGFTTPLVSYLARPGSPLDSLSNYSDVLSGMRAINVRYIVVNADCFRCADNASALVSTIRAHPKQISDDREFGTVTIFELHPWTASVRPPPEGQTPIERTAFHSSASHAPHQLERAFDGNSRTRWQSHTNQAGHEWIELRFEEPTDVAHVRLWMAPESLTDYPRQLLIESTADGNHYVELYQERSFPRMLIGLVDQPTYIPIDIALPENTSHTLRLRQTRTAPRFYWSIHDIQLWAR